MSRLQTALHIYLFAALGLFLLAVPWSPVWSVVTAAYLPTAAGTWLRSGFTRGLVAGLGVLNLVAAWGESRDLLRSLRGEPSAGPGSRDGA